MGLHLHSPEKLQEIVLPLRGLGLGSLTFQSLQFQNVAFILKRRSGVLEVDLLLVEPCLLKSQDYSSFHSAFLEALSLALQLQCAGSELSKCPLGKTGHTDGTPQVPVCHRASLIFLSSSGAPLHRPSLTVSSCPNLADVLRKVNSVSSFRNLLHPGLEFQFI